ncbi:helix-turn-helix domain-containing protein [Paraburkholderia phenazinium]|jgi:transcriptional regulator with XRE-family HTH domain|uniref:Helix-turn-helix n=1 Tax=Paraburkholderia phenazinium TaxID=60549 RepID=A0A1G7SVJ6_9BURK|nr:helix-turn-helix transcriptional regulator [Paraburkholderia phenazinium]SDG26459.1 Helix-turn-helix [Paraburkholderia phenazinium]
MSTLVKNFGAAVRELREARAWSQEQLAEHAGLNRSYVGEIERGSAIASIVTVDKLAAAFGVPIASLLRSSFGGSGAIATTIAPPATLSTLSTTP